MDFASARDLTTPRVVVGAADERLTDLAARIKGSGVHTCVVLDETKRIFVGLIQLPDLLGLSHPGNRILGDLVRPVPPRLVHPQEPAAHVAVLFDAHQLTEAVVVDEKYHYQGLITAQEVLAWRNQNLRQTEASLREALAQAQAAAGIKAAPEAPPPAARDESLPVPFPPWRILLVEDHPATSATLARILRRRGCHVTVAENKAEALAAADRETFDLVISDIGLPDGTGYELMGVLREKHGLRGIATSGFGLAADVKKAKEAGFEVHLTKPIVMTRLEAELKSGPWGPRADGKSPG